MPLQHEPAGLPDGFPPAWRARACAAWQRPEQQVPAQAWLELDLDDRLHFRPSLLVVAGQELWWLDTEGGAGGLRRWPIGPGLKLLQSPTAHREAETAKAHRG